MDIILKLKEELKVEKWQIEAAVKLIDEGNTIPFIARYRKEVTGSLNDEVLRNLNERLAYLRNLEERKATVLASIEEQGKLTEELKAAILSAETMVAVEDLYLPYRPKRRTRATMAKEKGLEPLAKIILDQELTQPLEEAAKEFINPDQKVETVADAIAGARDIIAEEISDNAQHRAYIRQATMEEGKLVTEAKDKKAESVYEMYYEFEEALSKAAGHRILAINRGEDEKILSVKVTAPEERILRYLEKQVVTKENPNTTPALVEALTDSYNRLIAPAIEREIRSSLTEMAQDGAINVFGKNLKQLLMQPPIAGKVVLGWDPAFRTGCKLAVVDETGKVLDTKVIYPTQPQNRVAEAKAELKKLIKKYNISLISVGNGTASRESEMIIVELLKEIPEKVQYVITNEAGASVYSASKLATEEFPQFDVGQRSAASIARRLQDPLAELVKIEPQAIGVGQYQHDMNQKKLADTLSGVVEDCVNSVGVDVNTASAALLSYISGISKVIAKNIVDYREKNGRFTDRRQLLKVDKLGPKAYEQCAGFLRIAGGDNPLDATSVHPESYGVTMELLKVLELTMEDVKELQKKAKQSAGKTASATGKTASGNMVSGAGAASAQKASAKPARDNRNNRPMRQDTAMAKALMAAMGGVAMEDSANGNGAGNGGRNGAGNAAGNGVRNGVGNTATSTATSSLAGKVRDKKKLAEQLGVGEITLDDILKELEKPARDPREDMPRPILRSDVLEMKDLKPGMILKGTVRNVIDFGAFVDIGVHQDGLVHISRMTDRYIKHPLEVVSVGDIVDVQVLEVDTKKGRISLTMKIKDGVK